MRNKNRARKNKKEGGGQGVHSMHHTVYVLVWDVFVLWENES